MSLTYDGFDLTRYATVRMTRPIGPSMREVIEDVPGRAGDVLLGTEHDVVRLVAHCTLKREYIRRWEHVRPLLAAAFSKRGEYVLTLPDEPGLTRMAAASFDGSVETPLEPPVTFDVTFACHDPHAYGAEREVALPSRGTVEFVVGGTVAAPLRIQAPAAVPENNWLWGIRFDGVDHSMVSLPLNSSSSVDIDGAARVCKVRGDNTLLTLDSHWPVLEPGAHEAVMVQGSGAATISWTEVWL